MQRRNFHEGAPAMTVIAMTREIGSHGSEVAAGVAAQLGLEIVNSEIVVPDVAGSLGVEQGVVQRYLDGKASLFDRWQVDARKLSRYTLDQVLNLAMKDNVLIRGWGATALFQGIRGILCVRVCASMAERVRVMMERLGMDADATRQEIERFDAANSRAMRASFNFDWTDALLYHVVLNSARLSVDACVKAVCELAQEQRFQDDTATKATLADKLLETRVRATLVEHVGSGEMAAITVLAVNGKVILEGLTSTGGLPARVARLAHEVEGVDDIDNRIVIVPSHGRF
jgi:cytidylate kinase